MRSAHPPRDVTRFNQQFVVSHRCRSLELTTESDKIVGKDLESYYLDKTQKS